jgi:hypothetical protein
MEFQSTILWLAVITMAIATAISVAVSFYLYRWRRILISDQALLVPESLISEFRSLGNSLAKHQKSVSELARATNSGYAKVSERISHSSQTSAQVLEASTTWQRALDERDGEIRRLKVGYDAELFRRFIVRFARAKNAAETFQSESEFGPKSLNQINRLLDDAFDECGLERFSPEIGEDYRTAKGVADNPNLLPTDRPEDAFRIQEVISAGYRSQSGEQSTVIVPAEVSILVFRSSNQAKIEVKE